MLSELLYCLMSIIECLSQPVMHIILPDTIRIYYLASQPLVLITFLGTALVLYKHQSTPTLHLQSLVFIKTFINDNYPASKTYRLPGFYIKVWRGAVAVAVVV